jgi:O-antigen/teichoic acid export membrane protein
VTTARILPGIGGRLSRNALWSLLGTCLPLLVALVTIPPLIEGLGTARFGVLSIAWMVVGYFSLFDFGLGRALTQLIARAVARGDTAQVPALFWAALALMTALGALGALTVAALSPWLVAEQLEIPVDLERETLHSFYLLAASIPIVIWTTALRGALEAYERFGWINLVRVPLGVMTYLGPVLVLPYSNELPAMVLVLVCIRALSCAVYFAVCLRLYPTLRQRPNIERPLVRALLGFGGWTTVSNIAAPLLLYLGRFVIAILISAEAVAYFSTPYDIVINLLIIPAVLVSVLFPRFASQFEAGDRGVVTLYRSSLLLNGAIMVPLSVATYLLAEPALAWWINPEFAANGHRVAELLALGALLNSFGHLSQAVVQAYGRPDLTAKLHLLELALYVPYLWWLIEQQGIVGAALAWVVRVTLSTAVLGLMAHRCLTGAIQRR